VIDTGTGGFNLHETEDCVFVRNFATGTPIRRHPKQVTFGENGQVVVGGSDYGTHTIVAATSNMRIPSTIKVWVYETTPPRIAMTKNTNGALDKLVNIVLLFAVLGFMFDYMVRNYIL
jgi:hypothetical protein